MLQGHKIQTVLNTVVHFILLAFKHLQSWAIKFCFRLICLHFYHGNQNIYIKFVIWRTDGITEQTNLQKVNKSANKYFQRVRNHKIFPC